MTARRSSENHRAIYICIPVRVQRDLLSSQHTLALAQLKLALNTNKGLARRLRFMLPR